MGSALWPVTMIDVTHLQRLLWIYCPGHAVCTPGKWLSVCVTMCGGAVIRCILLSWTDCMYSREMAECVYDYVWGCCHQVHSTVLD